MAMRPNPLIRLNVSVTLCLVLIAPWVGGRSDTDTYDKQRRSMVEAIEADVRATRFFLDKEKLDDRVMQAMGNVPRHAFVPESQQRHAYENRPLAIGYGQTISQPYIVALMTDLLNPEPDHRVFELGTGSGYQAAVLAELVDQVFTVEIVEPLGHAVKSRFRELSLHRIHSRIGDGYYGWPAEGPFDGIVVTAAASHVPPPLIEQLRPGGRLVIPVGSPFLTQQLLLVEKNDDGNISTRQILPVQFVPLTGGHD